MYYYPKNQFFQQFISGNLAKNQENLLFFHEILGIYRLLVLRYKNGFYIAFWILFKVKCAKIFSLKCKKPLKLRK